MLKVPALQAVILGSWRVSTANSVQATRLPVAVCSGKGKGHNSVGGTTCKR